MPVRTATTVPVVVALSVLAAVLALPGCRGGGDRTATVPLAGKVLAAAGTAPRRARVAVALGPRTGSREIAVVEPGADGKFSIAVPADTPCFLHVAAVDHEEAAVPVFLESGTEGAAVTVRLAANFYLHEPERVRIVGSWSDFDWRKAVEMTRQEDGTWTWEGEVEPGENGRVGYQLLDVVPNHSVNGTDAVDFEYDGGGDWISLVDARDGKARIVFDPSRLPTGGSGTRLEVSWDDAHRWLGEFHALLQEGSSARGALFFRYRKVEEEEEITEESLGEPFQRLVAYRRRLAEVARSGSPEPFRAWAASRLLAAFLPGDLLRDGKRAARELADAWEIARPLLPPRSPFWAGVDSHTLYRLVGTVGEDDGGMVTLLETLARENPVRDVRGQAMLALLHRADESGDEQAARRWWNEASQQFGDDRAYQWDLKRFDPDRRIAVGRPVPHFEVETVDGRKLSDRDLRGKVVLLDFWATWCGPCVGEMPNLHEAWRRFHDRGFEIVSFSLDSSPDAVRKFRDGKWKMPWTHVFLEGGFDAPVAKTFEVTGIPEPVLVGRDGTIVAIEPETRGTDLLAAVEKALAREDGGS